MKPGSRPRQRRPVAPPEMGNMPRWAKTLIRRANSLTPEPGFTEADMMTVWERCEGRCAVSGLEFSDVIVGTGRAKKPFAPSLDRIDRLNGYRPDNVRLVCVVANFAMNAWGQEPVRDLAEAMVERAKAEAEDLGDANWFARQDAKIAEAERLACELKGDALIDQRARIAGLRRARTLGPAGLMAAAEKAWITRGEEE